MNLVLTIIAALVSNAEPTYVRSLYANISPFFSDINECIDMTFETECHNQADCHNVDGSYTCMCEDGFSGDGYLNCEGALSCKYWEGLELTLMFVYHTDIDECMNSPCDLNANCTNLYGTFDCTCNGGYTGSGMYCEG